MNTCVCGEFWLLLKTSDIMLDQSVKEDLEYARYNHYASFPKIVSKWSILYERRSTRMWILYLNQLWPLEVFINWGPSIEDTFRIIDFPEHNLPFRFHFFYFGPLDWHLLLFLKVKFTKAYINIKPVRKTLVYIPVFTTCWGIYRKLWNQIMLINITFFFLMLPLTLLMLILLF